MVYIDLYIERMRVFESTFPSSAKFEKHDFSGAKENIGIQPGHSPASCLDETWYGSYF